MMGCHCVVSIHILRLFIDWYASITLQRLLHRWVVLIHLLQPLSARFHYASMTRFICVPLTTHILIYQLSLSCLLIYYNQCLSY